MSPHLVTLLLLAAPLRPPSALPGLVAGAEEVAPDTPISLALARQRAEELRFEEAVAEYNRYLTVPNRPVQERARALLELGFIHLVLGDQASARRRITEAVELDSGIKAPPDAPAGQVALLEEVRQEVLSRPGLEVLPTDPRDVSRVRARLVDPAGRASQVLLRHSLSPTGPFYVTRMRCEAGTCEGSLPPAGAAAYTTWYFLEVDDARGDTLARAGGPAAPFQLSVGRGAAWYESPWVYAGGAAAVVGAAAVFFFVTSATAQAPARAPAR